MKIRMIQTTVQELQVELPDETDSLMKVMEEANRLAKEGQIVALAEPRDLGCQVISVIRMEAEKEVVLMVHRMGQIVVTEEGGLHFAETRDATIAQKQMLAEHVEQAKQAELEKPVEERSN